MAWLDLHMHSCYSSDGEYTPKELIQFCIQNGVKTASITDHNSISALKEALDWADQKNFHLIPGIELDCTFQNVNLHLLGYWISPDFPPFFELEQNLIHQEQNASEKRIQLAQDAGFALSSSAVFHLAKNGVVTGEIIAEVALSQPENRNHPLLAPYYPGGSRSDNPYVNFYWDFCSQGKSMYVPISFLSLSEAVQLIRKAGGVPVLAHPGNNIKEQIPLLHAVLDQGIDAIEVYSSYHNAVQTAFYHDQAISRNLAITCGSDFHGKIKPSIAIGSVDCNGKEEVFLKGLEKKRKV